MLFFVFIHEPDFVVRVYICYCFVKMVLKYVTAMCITANHGNLTDNLISGKTRSTIICVTINGIVKAIIAKRLVCIIPLTMKRKKVVATTYQTNLPIVTSDGVLKPKSLKIRVLQIGEEHVVVFVPNE